MEKWATMSSITTKNNWETSYMNVKTIFLNRESKYDFLHDNQKVILIQYSKLCGLKQALRSDTNFFDEIYFKSIF